VRCETVPLTGYLWERVALWTPEHGVFGALDDVEGPLGVELGLVTELERGCTDGPMPALIAWTSAAATTALSASMLIPMIRCACRSSSSFCATAIQVGVSAKRAHGGWPSGTGHHVQSVVSPPIRRSKPPSEPGSSTPVRTGHQAELVSPDLREHVPGFGRDAYKTGADRRAV